VTAVLLLILKLFIILKQPKAVYAITKVVYFKITFPKILFFACFATTYKYNVVIKFVLVNSICGCGVPHCFYGITDHFGIKNTHNMV
jgi:hypothetical protein